ncbi:hypothetical protein UN64_05395 [Fictibacillus arsenicus]|uniref:Uncharacterized protein n=1 Tax=Fictibacillus arsenicus TaxID=255247 RepID=A0A1V3GCQ1_9BACL|nr:hypothetical protein UN64_05395 [Fictibacillus arsenicus]
MNKLGCFIYIFLKMTIERKYKFKKKLEVTHVFFKIFFQKRKSPFKLLQSKQHITTQLMNISLFGRESLANTKL